MRLVAGISRFVGGGGYNYMRNFTKDVELLDKAHKRAKKELRKQQKALAKKK